MQLWEQLWGGNILPVPSLTSCFPPFGCPIQCCPGPAIVRIWGYVWGYAATMLSAFFRPNFRFNV